MKNNDSNRIFLFDNIKFFLIILVVIGHLIDPVIDKSNVYKNLFTYIYLFHMPLFIFISGYFSKSFFKDGKVKTYKIIQFIILYLLLRFSETIVTGLITGVYPTIKILSTEGISWYLMAMCIWLSTIPIIVQLKPKYIMTISLIAGTLVGLDSSIVDFLATSRVFVFYPFFLGGYYLNKDTLQKILNSKNSLIAFLFLVIIGLIIFNNDFQTYLFRPLLTGRTPYHIANWGSMGILYRFIYYIIVFLIIGSIINLFPKNKTFYSKLGTRTLQVYFLHALVYIILIKTNFYPWFIENIPYWKISLILFSILLTFILSLKIFEFPFRWIGQSKFNALYKNTSSIN